jgi:hypothetical protein
MVDLRKIKLNISNSFVHIFLIKKLIQFLNH